MAQLEGVNTCLFTIKNQSVTLSSFMRHLNQLAALITPSTFPESTWEYADKI